MPPPQQYSHATRLFAFTLAEVLITLGIIGIVAALTIPGLITDYKKKQTVTQLKASYSLLSQAIQNSINDNGDLSTWDYQTLSLSEFAEKYLLPYLKAVKLNKVNPWKVYSIRPSSTGCYDWGWGPKYTLSNGSTLLIISFKNGVFIWVDLNSQKGPNVLGLDVFVFQLVHIGSSPSKKYGLIPYGSDDFTRNQLLGEEGGASGSACSTETGSDWYGGEFCAAVIMQDGWEISNDYPWSRGRKR